MELEKKIVIALRHVYDPEIPVNVYDLGLIYEIKVDDDHKAYITMTLTAPNCPMADQLLEDVQDAVMDVPGITDVLHKVNTRTRLFRNLMEIVEE